MRQPYLAELPLRISRIEDAWRQLQAGTAPPAALLKLQHNIQGLSATSAAHGLAELAAASVEFEGVLVAALESGLPHEPAEAAAAQALLEALTRAAAELNVELPTDTRPLGAETRTGPGSVGNIHGGAPLVLPGGLAPPGAARPALRTATSSAERVPAGAPLAGGFEAPLPDSDSARGTGATAEQRHVALLTTDQRLANEVTMQLRNFGFTVERLGTTSELQAAMRRRMPAALILDTLSPESAEEELHHIPEIRLAQAGQIPVLLVSVQDGVTAHLHAVRAGSQAYFVKPVDMHALIYTLERLTARQPPEPYRILVVDDEAKPAERHAQILRAAGMTVTVELDALHTMETMRVARPDLVLMDLNMPACSGLELAEVLRRQTSFVSTPIIFMSAPRGLLQRLDVQRLGDDFLTKPIEPRLLLSAVTSRAERSRQLRALMDRDSLTGLLNHTRTKEQLNVELMRAEREEQPLALALIDLDQFKSVNDRYGHASGDRVLMSVAHLLRRHLRKTDLIGRYGGEEFAVIFPNTSGANAARAVDQIREAFARVRQRSERGDFEVTLSAGIAEYPAHVGATALTAAADKALYEAKRGGRDRVEVAG